MNRNVVRILPDARLDEAIRVLYDEACGGAPVVSREGQLLGVVSEVAFLDALFDRGFRNAQVSEFMTRQVHFVEPGDKLEHVAHMFELYRIRRLPVLESGQVVGIVTRRDLIRHVLSTNESLSNPLNTLLPRVEELAL